MFCSSVTENSSAVVVTVRRTFSGVVISVCVIFKLLPRAMSQSEIVFSQ